MEQTAWSGYRDCEERFSILGEIEYMDRIDTAFKTARSLLNRLMGKGIDSITLFSKKLVTRLTQQLYLIQEAYKT